MAKLIDIEKGSDTAYEEALEIIRDVIEFELESLRRLLGIDPKEVLERLAKMEWDF